MRATLSILGIYNFRPDIFDDMQLPAFVNKDALLVELLAQCAELESLYTEPDTLKTIIGAWSKRRLWSWEKLADTLTLKYNPIWNVDGTETETITRSLNASGTEKSSASSSGQTNGSGEDLRSSYGYNSGNPEPAEKTERTSSANSTGNTSGDVATGQKEEETITTEKTRGGNIGVTMTQEMIKREREVSEFDIYQYIIDDFKGRFCLLLY